MSDQAHPIQAQVLGALSDLSWQRRSVRLLLGTDEYIPLETRVAFAPRHLRRLADDLAGLGLDLEVTVVAGAGDRAGFPDQAYREVGADVVELAETAALEPFDVVHALKEPTEYEAELRGPFLRLGALHLASRPTGVCRMFAERNFAAILDGGTVGNASYRVTGSDRTPIVGSMSRFAGTVAGRRVVEGLAERGVGPGRVVVVGGGIAGRSAIRQVQPVTTTLVVVEPWEPMRRRLEGFLPTLGFEAFEIVESLADDTLDGAVGVVFAHRTGAQAAEKVCHSDQIFRMAKGAAISDIAIDQGGAIAHPDYDPDDDAHVARQKYMALFDEDYSYYAEVNMPREEPREASESHGDAALPYVTTLLALCAHEGGAVAATRRLLRQDPQVVGQDETVDHSLLDAMVQDLRNGLQLAIVDGSVEIADPDIEQDTSLRAWVHDCAD